MPENYRCRKCGKVAKTKQALERHAAYHEDERPFSCEVCLQRFKNSDDRGKHYRRLKKDGKFTIACTVCHKHFKTQDILKKHTEMLGCNAATYVNTDQDASSSKNTKNEDSVLTVKVEHIPGYGISCTCKICETEFVSTTYLKCHYKEVHNDTKRQVCIQCGQTLSSKDSLARHFSIFHQAIFPFSCDMCNQKFKIKESLCRHVKFVHQDGGYECPECKRVFTQPVNLKKHLAVHSTLKEYACKICRREFKWKQALQKHELLHEKILIEVTDEANTEFDIDLDTTETSEKKKCDINDIIDEVIIVEDVTDKDIGRKLKDVTDDDIGRKLILFDIPSEQDPEGDVLSKQFNNASQYKCPKENVRKYDSCSTSLNNGTENPRGKRKGFEQQSSRVNKVRDEYDFQDEDENRHCKYNSTSIVSRKSTVGKRTCGDNSDFDHDKKKLKQTVDLTQNEGMALMAENIDKNSNTLNVSRKLGDSANQKNADSSCSDDSEFEMLTDNVDSLNRRDINTQDTPVSNTEVQNLKYSSLTSCPTSKTRNAPKLVFKPSSIQNIMARSDYPKSNTVTASTDEDDNPTQYNTRKSLFKFPISYGTLHTKLHNPFIIPNSSQKSTSGTVVSSSSHMTSIMEASSHKKDKVTSTNSEEQSNTVSAPREQSVPSGKFSLVKHMLSLQNEENFDKAIFENPLYSKPPDIKDFEPMVERHKVVDKSNDAIVQYDLSAKQNIPFHWLGMSVAKSKSKETSDNLKSSSEEADTTRQSIESRENCASNEIHYVFSDTGSDRDVSEQTSDFRDTDECQNPNENITVSRSDSVNTNGEVQRGFQAIKSLVVQKHKNVGRCASQNKSVLTNPFDYQNKQFQDNKFTCYMQRHTSQIPVFTSRNTPSSYKPEVVTGNETMCSFKSATHMDLPLTEGKFDKSAHYRRQHSVDSLSISSANNSAGLMFPRNYSTSSVASDASSSSVSFSRRYSVPSYTECSSNKPISWTSDSKGSTEKYLARKLYKHQMYYSSVESFDYVTDIPQQSYDESKDLVNPEAAVDRKEETLCGIARGPSETEVESNQEIDFQMLNKDIVQSQKLKSIRFDRNHLRPFCTKQGLINNVSPHLNCTEFQQAQRNSVREMSQEISPHGDWVTFSSGPVNQIFKIENIDADIDDTSKFDAYNMIDSPFGTSDTPLSVPTNSGHVIENSTSKVVHNGEVLGVPQEPEVMSSNCQKFDRNGDFENRNDSVREKQRTASNLHVIGKCFGQQEERKRPEVSIFDMLRLVQEGKGKEFDHVESLLGAYI